MRHRPTEILMILTSIALGVTFLGVILGRGPVIIGGIVAFTVLLFLTGQVDYRDTLQRRREREAELKSRG
ncbi:hypothetical protein LAJ19_18100 (plasmid) [Deinococcus taeanensis]|uniref:hypothetical protein n=1 Tax=Deinococcus taeanensis TaxID=2737050 RepID=UPI001CDC6436|nr:hypothetical protein [Deinococcus taeanensis]UBV45038.1 hypothetical protein LAJ19_18100 [Deinococcus taeanensis]